MKRVRCPKCDNYIVFDEKRYEPGKALVFQCPECNKQFGIRIPAPKQKEDEAEEEQKAVAKIVVLENMFHFRQELPLHMGDNIIGRYQKGQNIQCPIESSDPSIDMHHCVISVQNGKNGKLKFVLRDGPSYTGTFVGDQILGDREKRIIDNGTVFTCGATSIILKTGEDED